MYQQKLKVLGDQMQLIEQGILNYLKVIFIESKLLIVMALKVK